MDFSMLKQYLPAIGQIAGGVLGQINTDRQTRPYYFAGDMSGMGSKLITPYENRGLALEERLINQRLGANISEMLRGNSYSGKAGNTPYTTVATQPYQVDREFITSDTDKLNYLRGNDNLELPRLNF